MMKSLLWSIILLPGSVTIFIPIFFLYLSSVFSGEGVTYSENIIVLGVSIFLIVVGSFLAGTTTLLFFRCGKGTPAPWDPPKKLVVAGPYRYMRNPMITGILLILFGEAGLFWSLVLFFWAFTFLVANMLYFPFVEEKKLFKRFGKDYDVYTKNVPRWIPRFKPWGET
jgi:protein-S-isoprenylcysteine O-methyltransferase Ste14